MYTQNDLADLYAIWTGSQYPQCVRAQAETYISILSDSMLLAWSDGIEVEEDTFERAMMFVELVADGESHQWLPLALELKPMDVFGRGSIL